MRTCSEHGDNSNICDSAGCFGAGPYMPTLNRTRHAQSCREALEHILNYLASVDDSELSKAESAAKDAAALAYTRREWALAKRLERWAVTVQSSTLAGTMPTERRP